MLLRSRAFRVACAFVGTFWLTGCTTGFGPGDVLGSARSAALPGAAGESYPTSPVLGPDPSAAPLTPGAIATPSTAPATSYEQGAGSASVASAVQPLGDLPRRADGTMILPPAPRLDVIEIQPLRDSLTQTSRYEPPFAPEVRNESLAGSVGATGTPQTVRD